MSLDDKYTYPGSGGVLVNKLGITDREELDGVMNELASIAWATLATEGPPPAFEFEYLQRIHREMFGELFSWAGTVRDVNTAAGNTGIVYARPDFLADNLAEMFQALSDDHDLLTTSDPFRFSEKLSAHWGFLTLLHPFRDGNTRSQSLFVSSLAWAAGHHIDWRRIEVDALRTARLRTVLGDEKMLAELLGSALGGRRGDAVAFEAPTLRADSSNSAGVAATEVQGRCLRPRSNGRGLCQRRIGDRRCPYHG